MTSVFEEAAGFERVLFALDEAAGLRAIIAVHSTRLGPAIGGLRIRPYPNEAQALRDALRLGRAMTWKAAAAGLDLGGGKAVIIADPMRDRSESLLRAFGRAVETLGGRYVTSVDVGTTTADMDEIRRETRWVTAVSRFNGGQGDPSPYTARGVAAGIGASLYHLTRESSVRGRRVAIQGAGKVGSRLAAILCEAGAEVVVADPNLDHVASVVCDHPVSTCAPEDILEVDCDVLAPCALGGVLDDKTVPRLRCLIVCGAANNQLATPEDAQRLRERGILYAPDFIVNAGGLISVADELRGWDADRVATQVDRLGRTLMDVLHIAAERDITTEEAAISYAKDRISRLSALAPR